MNTYYAWFALFAIVLFLIVTDKSVERAFYLLSQLIKVQYEKQKWWLLHNPRNPIVKYLMWRRAYKLAKELQDELKSNAK
jgi:hypothetical protein